MTFLDTNIFVRYLVRDVAHDADSCRALFRALDRGEQAATTSEAIIAEVVYVLAGKVYQRQPAEIASLMKPLLNVRGFKLAHKARFTKALDLYASYPFLGFEDALSTIHAQEEGWTICSFDRDFDRVPGISRVEPAALAKAT